MAKTLKAIRKPAMWFLAIVLSWVIVIAVWEIKRGFDAAEKLPDELEWHRLSLSGDDATQFADFGSFADYRDKEWDRIASLRQNIRERNANLSNRYAMDSLSSSTAYRSQALERLAIESMVDPKFIDESKEDFDCNLSFELQPAEEVRAVAVLVHGLSDSPYHMWALAKILRDKGCYVYGLRLPGHGTTPAGLTTVTMEDWYAATEFAVTMARREHPNVPLFLGGFSTGGALCVRYTLEANKKDKPDRLFLFAPAIAVDNANAMFAGWHKFLTRINPKIKWLSISPEIDPCKYLSFGKWGGYQVYRLSKVNAELIEKTSHEDLAMVKIHAFQSVVDATVSEPAVARFFAKVASTESEMVIFDINHKVRKTADRTWSEKELLLPEQLKRFSNAFDPVGTTRECEFTITWISNLETYDGGGVPVVYQWNASEEPRTLDSLPEGTALAPRCEWPEGVFALSHTCIPISPKDLFYGETSILTNLSPVGEREVIALSADDLTRLRYNPFFEYLKARIEDWVDEELGMRE